MADRLVGSGSSRLAATILGLVGLLGACSSAPISIRGKVIDGKGTPIKGAEIETRPETDPVQSNQQGWFIVRQRINDDGVAEPLPPGEYEIRVKMMGFDDIVQRVTVASGEVVLKDLILQERSLELGDTAPDTLDERAIQMEDSSTPIQGN